MEGPLKLYRGSVEPLRIELVDGAGAPEDLDLVTRAVLRVSNDTGGSVLARDTETDVAGSAPAVKQLVRDGSALTVNLSQAEADALPLGTWSAQMNLEFPIGWVLSQQFFVVVLPGNAPALVP